LAIEQNQLLWKVHAAGDRAWRSLKELGSLASILKSVCFIASMSPSCCSKFSIRLEADMIHICRQTWTLEGNTPCGATSWINCPGCAITDEGVVQSAQLQYKQRLTDRYFEWQPIRRRGSMLEITLNGFCISSRRCPRKDEKAQEL
jgi:hypothetical protein